MPAQSPPLTEVVSIERLIHGGNGLARLSNGRVVFVPWTAPGDEAEITVLDAGKNKPPAVTLEAIKAPSPDRVTPPCSVFGTCGGCQWQHVSANAQRHWKREIVAESIRRLGKLPDVNVNDVIAVGEFEYRNNVQWVVSEGRDKLGYFKHQSHDLVSFDRCHLVNDTYNALHQWLESNPKFFENLTGIQVRNNTQGEFLLVLEGDSAPETPLLQALASAQPAIKGVVLVNAGGEETVIGQNFLNQTLAGKSFRVSATSFFQVNTPVAEAMMATMAGWLPAPAEGKKLSLLDVYAGVGTFAVAFADRFNAVLAVESSAQAVEDARVNAAAFKNITLYAGSAKEAIKTLGEQDFDVAIIDPPRAGVEAPVLSWLSQRVKQTLVYVSCDPATLARDLAVLAADGWKIETVQPFDMFPQTWHVETLVLLSR